MTTLTGFATPIDLEIFGHPLGDHTWVASDESGVCWNCLGGGPGYYCGPNRWKAGHYTPPEGHQICSGNCAVPAARCMGEPQQGSFMGLPSSAGIVYAVNGVCHQIANRVLYWTGATVDAAAGYWFSSMTFGIWGTTVPAQACNPLIVGPVVAAAALAYEVSVWVDWLSRTTRCTPPSTPAPPDDATHVARVKALHETVRARPPASRGDRLALHLEEIALTLTHRLGPDFDRARCERVQQLFTDRYATLPTRLEPPPPAAGAVIDAKGIAQRFNEDVSGFYSTVADALGAAAYQKVFNAVPGTYVGLINPESLAGAAG